jgi:2-polyprenyl-3-methyl-5-hydroxy-6-metoxy-1,4-benzoquinol methylase
MSRLSNCRICNNDNLVLVRYLCGKIGRKDIPLFKCPKCSSFFTPSDSNTEMPSFKWKGGVEYYLKKKDHKISGAKLLLQHVCSNEKMNGRRYLDIGCAMGCSLIAAQSHGFEAYGVEPETYIAEYAKNSLQLNVINSLFKADLFEKSYFDVILINQVLEHVPYPGDMFQDIVKILKPGGTLILGVPPVDWLRVCIGNIVMPFVHKSKVKRIARLNVFYGPESHINFFQTKSVAYLCKEYNVSLLKKIHSSRFRAKLYSVLNLSSSIFIIKKPTR